MSYGDRVGVLKVTIKRREIDYLSLSSAWNARNVNRANGNVNYISLYTQQLISQGAVNISFYSH
jgi:hypothetical protein